MFSQPLCPDALPLAVGRGRRIHKDLCKSKANYRWDRPLCCDLVAIGFNLTVMGKIVTKVCDIVDGSEPVNVTLPQIEDDHPFPEPVKSFAVRCFVDTPPVHLDGSSCPFPNAPSSVLATPGAEDQSQTWNLRNRIDEYVDSLSAFM